MLIIEKCLVCGSNQFEPFLVCKDYTVSQESFNIVSCKSCDFKFTNPRPDNSVLGNYYKAESYISHTNSKKGIINKLYHMVRSHTLKQKVKLISSYVSRGTILDYGCGTGMFLSECKKVGWETFGIEPDNNARQIASEQNLNLFADKDTLQLHIVEKEYDAITLWHVLEHVTDMSETLVFFKQKLKQKGVLIIAVPNHKSYDAQFYNEYWAAYDVPRHLHHFELKSMKALLENYGFQLIETKPMKFDSFYVSMLSEKYKTGILNLAKAFKIGTLSNMKAKDSSSYSSTIYIFQHK
ncbi:MAG: class I SAM-dependent methyltransferase [Burkholderiales bacterium]|nr:class I SAM-dependent methyltransferase [Bacteroidia bacterium]